MPNHLMRLRKELLRGGKKFPVVEARTIVDRIYNECRLDTGDRFHNIFFYEICPLVLIAERVGDDGTVIAFTGANSRFDGLILWGNEQRSQRVEFTVAIDGYNDALRMELLERQGHTPAFQEIHATGIRSNRVFSDNETNAIRSEEYDHRTLLPLLEDALALKIKKAKTNQHYPGAWLGIVFDDWICPMSETHKKRRFNPLCRHLLGDDARRYSPFARVFCVGVSRRYFYDSWVQGIPV